jgi:putative membrane protein
MGGEIVAEAKRGRSAQAEVDRLSSASEYLFDLPRASTAFVAILVLSFIMGLYFWPFDINPWYIDWPKYSILVFALPAYLAALFSYGWLKLIGGKTYFYRATFLSLINLGMIGVVLLPGRLLEWYADLPRAAILLFAYSTLVLINYLSILMTSTSRKVLSLPAVLAQPVAGYLAIFFAYYWEWETSKVFVTWELPVLAIIFVLSFLIAGMATLYIGTRPLYLTYGVSGVDLFRAFLDHWVEHGDAGRPDIERFFKIFAEPMHAWVSVIRFRERESKEPITTWVTPSIHPGPWGQIGASDLPKRLSESFGGTMGEVLTFHGASDHDLNPITHEEVDRFLATTREAAESVDSFAPRASPFIRRSNGFDACVQAFNGSVLAMHTSAPEPTDDVDGPTGFVIEKGLREMGAAPGIFVDAHNCLAPGVGGVSFGTPKSTQLVERLNEAAGEALAAQQIGIRVGVKQVAPPRSARGLGYMGVQATVVEVGGQRMAWVLVDGNNIVCGLRESLRDRLMDLVDEAEVLTTDNHIVNIMVGGFNPIGLRDPNEEITRCVVEAVQGAIDDLRDAEVGAVRADADHVLVFGKGNTIRLSGAVNSAVATAKGALPAGFALATAISAFAAYVLGYAL